MNRSAYYYISAKTVTYFGGLISETHTTSHYICTFIYILVGGGGAYEQNVPACSCLRGFLRVCARAWGEGGATSSKRAGKLPVWKEKSDWNGDVIRSPERGGGRSGRLDSIKPEACRGKKLFGIRYCTFSSQRLLLASPFFSSRRRGPNNLIHDLKSGRPAC